MSTQPRFEGIDLMAERVLLAEAITELVHDGDVVALEGFTHLIRQ